MDINGNKEVIFNTIYEQDVLEHERRYLNEVDFEEFRLETKKKFESHPNFNPVT